MAHPPHPLNFLVIVLLGGGSQAPCGLDSKAASLKKWNSLSHLLPPTSTPGPNSEVGSPLLGLILPDSHLPVHPLVPMSCLGPGYMSWTPGSVCLLPLLSFWPQPKPLQLLSCLEASVWSRRGLGLGFIQKVRTFRCEKTASPRPRGEQAGGWLLSRKRHRHVEPPLELNKNSSSRGKGGQPTALHPQTAPLSLQ